MQWQLQQFAFDSARQTLTCAQQQQQLEPMAAELLAYFCQHPARTLSKDELIMQVWQGRIVTDNAVARLITKLRKALGDDPQQPQFIATLPKKGYRLIAAVTPLPAITATFPTTFPTTFPAKMLATSQFEISATAAHSSPHRAEVMATETAATTSAPVTPTLATSTRPTRPQLSPLRHWFLLATLLLLSLGFGWFSTHWSTAEPTAKVSMLTQETVPAHFAQLSPNEELLLYTTRADGKVRQYLKRLRDQQQIEISHGADLGVGPASWSPDGLNIVYLVATSDSCEYWMRPVTGLQLGPASLVHRCPAGSFGMIRYTHQADEVIFAARQHRQSPYLLYRLNLRSQQLLELNQPQALNAGNSQFDLHPTQQKILISSPDQQQWEGFYQLDLTSNQLTLLFKQNAYVCCGIWSHDGQHIVLTGKHPASELVAYDLNGQLQHILYAGPHQISWPQRHPNGRDYLFTGHLQNSQLQLSSNGDVTSLFSHSSNDQLGRFAPDGQRIAFVSQRSGREQVWLTDTSSRQPMQLTQWPENRHVLDLVWSPNGRQLAVLTLNQIHLIQRSNGDSQQLALAETSIRGLSFKDNDTLAFSLPAVQGWQLYYFHLPSQQLQKADERWAFARFSPNAADTIWQDQQHQLFYGTAATPVTAVPLKVANLLDGRQFNLQKQGDAWYWQQMQQGYQLYQFDTKAQQRRLLQSSNLAGFDVFEQQIVLSDSRQNQANIYSTGLLNSDCCTDTR